MKLAIILTISLSCIILFPVFLTHAEETYSGFASTLPRAEDKEFYYKEFQVSAYTLREEETDSTPFIGAGLTDLRFERHTFASNQLPLGAFIEYNGEIWQNQDRMNRRYKNNLDLCYKFNLKGAREFGRKSLLIKVFK